MRRWGLWIALMLSVGVNIGVLVMVIADRRLPRRLDEPRSVEPLLPEELAGPSEPVLLEEPAPSPEAQPVPPPETEPAPLPRTEPEPSPPPEPSTPPAPSPSPLEEQATPAPETERQAEPEPRRAPQPPPERGPSAEALRRATPQLDLLADRLQLRGPQRERFLEAQRRFFTEVTARRVELATLRRELRRQLTSPQPDRQLIRRLLERSGRATAELDAAFAENVLTVRRILGPRQQQAYFRFLERVRSGMERQNRPGQR